MHGLWMQSVLYVY